MDRLTHSSIRWQTYGRFDYDVIIQIAHCFVIMSYDDPPGCSSRSVGQQDLLKWFARISWAKTSKELSGAIMPSQV